MRRLKADNVAVVFISHKLPEVFAICERILVLRNGVKVADGPGVEFDVASLSHHMLGRRLEQHAAARASSPAPSSWGRGLGRDGRSTTSPSRSAPARCSASPACSAPAAPRWPKRCLASPRRIAADFRRRTARAGRFASRRDALGIGYVPADRLTEGLFLPQSISRNLVVSSLDRMNGQEAFFRAGVAEHDRRVDRRLHVVTPDADLPVSSLSGGNQQRVVLGAGWPGRRAILILNGPTVGVDVGSKADIHAIIAKLATKAWA